jgi:hypothetical protein
MECLSLFSEIFSITDVIILAVFLVAIGIGVRVAFRQSRLEYGEWGFNYLESSDSGCPDSEPDAQVDC